MWMEPLAVAGVLGSVALGWAIVRRGDANPLTCWAAGWVAGGASCVLAVVRDAFPWAYYLSFPLGSAFPALLLAGALLLASRPVPGWLIPAAVGFGVLRAGLQIGAGPELAFGVALVVEPLVVLAAAWLAYRALPRQGASRAERLVAPSLVLLAIAGAVHLVWMMRASEVSPALMVMWVSAVPPLFGVQVYAEWERMRRAIQHAQGELEERVAVRTAELRASEERHRVISELGSDLAFGFRTDLAYGVRGGWVTDAFARITGYTLEDLKGPGWRSLVHPDDVASCEAQISEIVAGHVREMEHRIITRDGRVLVVLARLDVTREDADGSLRIVGAAHDVTEMRRAEDERRKLELRVLEAQRLESLAMLTGGVAHDFNNLLAVILGNGRMALADTSADSPLHERLSRIRTAAEHGARLTEQMLAYSGRSAVALKPIDLAQLVEEMADLLRASVAKSCRLELDLSQHAVVDADDTQLRQVVLNLVTNASDALIDGRGTVCVRTGLLRLAPGDATREGGAAEAPPGTYAFVEVRDDGRGMDAATRARMFEPFFTTKFPGRGLGLAAVQGIVGAHRGSIDVRSEAGRGTTVRALLPEAGAAVAPRPKAAPLRGAGGRHGTVLVIDDDASVVEVAEVLLERAGHSVVTALGGREGIARFRERGREIDAVVLDLAMPDVDGEEVLRELRRFRPDVRVVIATGYAAAERVRAEDVIGVLRKPYEPEQLIELIDLALAEPV